MQIKIGKPEPLGASVDDTGVNFAIFSAHAERIELCLFENERSQTESVRIELPGHTGSVFHGFIPELKPGQLYGYRVHGPYLPREGHRFNSRKVLCDPYARECARIVRYSDDLFGYDRERIAEGNFASHADSAASAILGVVATSEFSWGEDSAPKIAWERTVIYETHVRGMTMLHEHVPSNLRGTFLGLVSEPILRHLTGLGITAVELLPVHFHVDEERLQKLGLTNYWGYNSLGYFALDPRFVARSHPLSALDQFKYMVREFHRVGIEVILDVVYNHTGEGNELGPTLSFRGIDNRSYYRLDPSDLSRYVDFSGCGNTLDCRQRHVRDLILDSLRYWVGEMHVDGFRFDLTSALIRADDDVDTKHLLLEEIASDPVLSKVKLIAEPWDVGAGGYQIGAFPEPWVEWNDQFRDTSRRFWRGNACSVGAMATRISGSSDIFNRRSPLSTINFVTCHDGFTLEDLVSHQTKHNESNGEENRDGIGENYSMNFGVEGKSADPEVTALRMGMKRNLLATVFLSAGVPMILGGDELSRTQSGNNNPYCQDNETNWFDWRLTDEQQSFLGFVRKLISVRQNEPVLRRTVFFQGVRSDGTRDILWLHPSGKEMGHDDWRDEHLKAFGLYIDAGKAEEGESETSSYRSILVILNAQHNAGEFRLPSQFCMMKASQFEAIAGLGGGINSDEAGLFVVMKEKALSAFFVEGALRI